MGDLGDCLDSSGVVVGVWEWRGRRSYKSCLSAARSLADIAALIRGDLTLALNTDKARAIIADQGKSAAYKAFKYGGPDKGLGAFPAVTYAGVFEGRRRLSDLDAFKSSGLVFCDIDGVDADGVYRGIVKSESVALAYRSMTGVHAVVSVSPAPITQKEYACALKAAASNLGVCADKDAADITRVATLVYDPLAYYNPDPDPIFWDFSDCGC